MSNELNTPKKEFISYEKYSELVDKLYMMLNESSHIFGGVHGFIRGGLPIAVHLSHYLKIPLITRPNKFNSTNNDKLLVVDDIIDSGKTMQYFNVIAETFHIPYISSGLYWKPDSTFIPDFYVYQTSDWIVFPWEKFDEECVITDNYIHEMEILYGSESFTI